MTDMLQELPTAPVPDKAPTVVDDISKAGGGIASGIGVWLAAGLVAYGAIRYKSKS
jgi:hypothetical protein